ncbi:hypothetical protein PIB30_050191 [Stylosanthes scabra]|uniref:Uncharacterized protein n=1 Tax=Stylosanthes scabra TaxID=79078 RepID=A0ABU6THZ1_9FABA|nr:hypothetical protein [Stylosanthes scabra]
MSALQKTRSGSRSAQKRRVSKTRGRGNTRVAFPVRADPTDAAKNRRATRGRIWAVEEAMEINGYCNFWRKEQWLAGVLQEVRGSACGGHWQRGGARLTRDGKRKMMVRAVTNQSVGRGLKIELKEAV